MLIYMYNIILIGLSHASCVLQHSAVEVFVMLG